MPKIHCTQLDNKTKYHLFLKAQIEKECEVLDKNSLSKWKLHVKISLQRIQKKKKRIEGKKPSLSILIFVIFLIKACNCNDNLPRVWKVFKTYCNN